MKAMITCDEVFDVLTRGPFPTGADQDEAVEMHLAGCHECRQLAEALRPAVALFHETLDESTSSLPTYRGRLARLPAVELPPPQRVYWDEEHLLDLPVKSRPASPVWRLQPETAANFVRFASSALLGVALCLIVWTFSATISQRPTQARPQRLATYAVGTLRLGPRTALGLAAIPRPEVCRTKLETSPTVAAEHADASAASLAAWNDQACCSRCHAAAHPGQSCSLTWKADCQTCHLEGPPMRLRTREVSLQQQTCQVCHDG